MVLASRSRPLTKVRCDKAGLSLCSSHGLRKAICRRITGHYPGHLAARQPHKHCWPVAIDQYRVSAHTCILFTELDFSHMHCDYRFHTCGFCRPANAHRPVHQHRFRKPIRGARLDTGREFCGHRATQRICRRPLAGEWSHGADGQFGEHTGDANSFGYSERFRSYRVAANGLQPLSCGWRDTDTLVLLFRKKRGLLGQ